MSSNIPVAWTKHLRDPEEKASFEATLRGNVQLFTVLRDILMEHYEEILRQEGHTTDYESGSWAYKQAHLNGMKDMLAKMRTLTDFIEGPNR